MGPEQNETLSDAQLQRVREASEAYELSFGDLSAPESADYLRFEESPCNEFRRRTSGFGYLQELASYATERADFKRADFLHELSLIAAGSGAVFSVVERRMLVLALGQITDWKKQPLEALQVATFVKTCGIRDSKAEANADADGAVDQAAAEGQKHKRSGT